MHRILVIRLYFLLDALHVSDCISPSSGAIVLQAVCRIRYMPLHADTSGCCVAIATQQPNVLYRHIPAYTKCDVQLIKLLLMMD